MLLYADVNIMSAFFSVPAQIESLLNFRFQEVFGKCLPNNMFTLQIGIGLLLEDHWSLDSHPV